ncbi:MAG: FISUMP domain-containing protein, partial [Bacteroidota bacterium]
MRKIAQYLGYSFLLMGLVLSIPSGCKKKSTPEIPATVTDIDGYVYHTVKIGSQVWMVENLRVTRFNNGMSVELAGGPKSTGEWDTPRYCWYSDSVSKTTYGALYNWYAVSTGKLAP